MNIHTRMASSNEDPNNQALTAIKIFRRFIVQKPDGTLDASGVNSSECYQMWLASRKKLGKNPEIVFQRTLTGHLGAVDGRHPFSPVEEQAILKHLRIRQRWPCFRDSSIRFGELGYRALGYHERLAQEEQNKSKKPLMLKNAQKQNNNKTTTKKTKKKTSTSSRRQQRRRLSSEDSSSSSESRHSSLSSSSSNASDASNASSATSSARYFEKSKKKKRRMMIDEKESLSTTNSRGGEEGGFLSASTTTGTITTTSSSSAASSSSILYSDHSEPVTDVTSTLEHDLAYLAHLRSIGAPPPPPAQPSSWHAMNIHYLLTSAWSIVSHISDPRMWWSFILGFVRYRLITRGWYVGPTMEDARRRMEEWQTKFPNEAINVYDFTAVDYTQRIMLQNELSVAWFGGISRAYGGFTGKRFQPKDGWKLFKVVAQAFTYRDTEQPLHLQWILSDGTSTAYFDSVFMCCEASRLIIERKKLSPWQYDF